MASINKRLLAESYGFSAAMLNSNSELKKLFNKAVKENWAPDMFVARVRGTKWYKRTRESVRNAQVQKKSDPATYSAMVQQNLSRVSILAHELGSQASHKTLRRLAEQGYAQGWDDNQLRRHLAATVKRAESGRLEGQAGEWERQWRDYANQMGVSYGRDQYTRWARRATQGYITPEDVTNAMLQSSKSKFPQFAKRLDAGETMQDIAEPYRQTMGELLERDPRSIPWSSRTLQKGLSSKNKDGDPTSMSLYSFQDLVRQNSTWRYTDNAKKQADEVVRSLGTLFGKMS